MRDCSQSCGSWPSHSRGHDNGQASAKVRRFFADVIVVESFIRYFKRELYYAPNNKTPSCLVGFLGYCRLQKANALFKLATPAAGSGTSCRLYIIDYEHTSLLFPPSVLPLFFSSFFPFIPFPFFLRIQFLSCLYSFVFFSLCLL